LNRPSFLFAFLIQMMPLSDGSCCCLEKEGGRRKAEGRELVILRKAEEVVVVGKARMNAVRGTRTRKYQRLKWFLAVPSHLVKMNRHGERQTLRMETYS
jgi:hypothetical protein